MIPLTMASPGKEVTLVDICGGRGIKKGLIEAVDKSAAELHQKIDMHQ